MGKDFKNLGRRIKGPSEVGRVVGHRKVTSNKNKV